jgi:hypothetical protein
VARKDAEKPMLSLVSTLPANHVQCAADAACRKPGRMWIEPHLQKERVCIAHYYFLLDRQRGVA